MSLTAFQRYRRLQVESMKPENIEKVETKEEVINEPEVKVETPEALETTISTEENDEVAKPKPRRNRR